MDIKETVSNAVQKITSDKSLLENFKKDPVKTVESAIGVDIPDDVVSKVVDAVKAKIGADNAAGILGKVTGLFKK